MNADNVEKGNIYRRRAVRRDYLPIYNRSVLCYHIFRREIPPAPRLRRLKSELIEG